MDLKERNLVILGILILIICFCSVNFSDKITGFAITYTCEETDDGKDYYNFGTITQMYSNGLLKFGGRDSCLSSVKLKEFWCDGTGFHYKDYTCPYGCLNGRCKKPCSDSDNGLDYLVSGYVEVFSEKTYDECEIIQEQHTGNILERFCDNYGDVETQKHACGLGCSQGACIEEPPIDQPCTDSDDGINFNIQGTVVDKIGESYTDFCDTVGPPPYYIEGVREYFCDHDDNVDEAFVPCLCVDGVCTDESPTCTDSDEGKNYYEAGYIAMNSAEGGSLHLDSCLDTITLLERYCDGSIGKYELYDCEDGCESSACIGEEEPPEEVCILLDAYWDYEDAEKGDYVNLIVRGTQACDRESASFTIYEYKDDEETSYYVSGCVFGDITCVTDWRAYYEPEDFDEDYGDELEFYFIADVDGQTVTSSNELTVTEETSYEDDDDYVFDVDEACYENWDCSEWTVCIGGRSTRTCVERNECGTEKYRPSESMACFVAAAPTCSDGIRNQGEEKVDCGIPCEPCASCFDGKQNCHDGMCEEKEDCGGTCAPCKNLGWLILKTILILLAIGAIIFGVWYWKFRKSGGKAGKALGKIMKKPTTPPFGPPTRLKIS